MFIDLTNVKPIASGTMRDVYETSLLPNDLIKIIRRSLVDKNGNLYNTGKLKNWRSFGAYTVFNREMQEYLRSLRRSAGELMADLPITHIRGFADTSEGVGLVVEKITDEDRKLAPSLRFLKKSGQFNSVHQQALGRFQELCKDRHIVLGDTNLSNIVYTTARNNKPEMVCVDGFGEKAAIPVHRYFKSINARSVDRKLARLRLPPVSK